LLKDNDGHEKERREKRERRENDENDERSEEGKKFEGCANDLKILLGLPPPYLCRSICLHLSRGCLLAARSRDTKNE